MAWKAKAEGIGLDRESIRSTFGLVLEMTGPKVMASAVEETLTAHASHFDRRDVIQAVADQLRANVLRSEGLDATSVARLLAQLDRHVAAGHAPLARNSVLLVDGAGDGRLGGNRKATRGPETAESDSPTYTG